MNKELQGLISDIKKEIDITQSLPRTSETVGKMIDTQIYTFRWVLKKLEKMEIDTEGVN